MNRLKLFYTLLFVFSVIKNITGQQKIYLDFGAGIGTAGINMEGTQLKNLKPVFNQNNLSVGVSYKIGRFLEFGFHYIDQNTNWKFTDNHSIALKNGDYVKLETQSKVQVQAFSGNLVFLTPFKSNTKIQWILSTGYQFGNTKPYSNTNEFIYNPPEISISQTNTKQKYQAAFIESGINLNLGQRLDFRIGAGYNYSFQPIYKCDYNIQTPDYKATTMLSSNGSGAFLSSKLSIAIISIKKHEKKPGRYTPQFNDKNEVTSIDGREVKTAHELKVSTSNIEIQIWDYGKEDGDKISLFLDGNQLLKKYVLTNRKKKISLSLKPGINKLIVYAHNLGKDPPNTASVSINNGNEKHLMPLQSTLGECGSISIIYEP